MDLDILKIDLDLKYHRDARLQLRDRLCYMHDLKFLDVTVIKSIELIKKTNYSAKIYLNHQFDEKMIVILQLLLGSDWRKEVNTIINHYKLGMEYSNRMFDVKRYKHGEIKKADKQDITRTIVQYIKSSNRKINKN